MLVELQQLRLANPFTLKEEAPWKQRAFFLAIYLVDVMRCNAVMALHQSNA